MTRIRPVDASDWADVPTREPMDQAVRRRGRSVLRRNPSRERLASLRRRTHSAQDAARRTVDPSAAARDTSSVGGQDPAP